MALDLFAVIAVRDYQAALPWYERLLEGGRNSMTDPDTRTPDGRR